MFSGSKKFNVFLNTIASAFKSCIIPFYKNLVFLGLRKFSNLSVLHKGVLMQDWVFRLGLTLFTSMYIINPKDTKNCECDIVPIVKNSNI